MCDVAEGDERGTSEFAWQANAVILAVRQEIQ